MNSLLNPEIIRSNFSITGYGSNFIEVNKKRWDHSCIVSTFAEPKLWKPTEISQIDQEDLRSVVELRPDVMILGTGNKQYFLPPDLRTFERIETNAIDKFLNEKSHNPADYLSIECMTTHAACRTFNILAAEGRMVVAVLLISNEKEL